MTGPPIAQVSSRGTVTLPAIIRRELGLEEGDVLTVEVAQGAVVLRPVLVQEVELYTDERIREFEEASSMTPEELADVRRRLGLQQAPMAL